MRRWQALRPEIDPPGGNPRAVDRIRARGPHRRAAARRRSADLGRAGEEVNALRDAAIAFEIVPGVTAASAAAAAAGIPLTDRRLASKLIFLSAHRRHADNGAVKATSTAEMRAGETAGSEVTANWKSLPTSDATLAIYMPGSDYGRLAAIFSRQAGQSIRPVWSCRGLPSRTKPSPGWTLAPWHTLPRYPLRRS